MPQSLENPCLYCAELHKPASREHVVHEAFGGSLVLDEDVCEECNVERFSRLDTELVRFVRLFVYANDPAVSLGRSFLNEGVGHYVDAAGVWHTAWLDQNGAPVVMPQIIFVGREPDGRLRTTVVLDRNQEPDASGLSRIAQMQHELSQPQRLRLTPMIVSRLSPDYPAVQPALVRSGPYTYAARAGDNRTADLLIGMARIGSLLEIALLERPPATASFHPEMHKETRYDQGAIARSLVKTALNFVCAALGSEVARRAGFDVARKFAYSSDGTRFSDFIRPLWGAEVDERIGWIAKRVVKPQNHTLLLADVSDVPMVFLTLYERPFAAILLAPGPVPGALPPDPLTLGLFDYNVRTHRILRAAHEPDAFGEAFAPIGGRGYSLSSTDHHMLGVCPIWLSAAPSRAWTTPGTLVEFDAFFREKAACPQTRPPHSTRGDHNQ